MHHQITYTEVHVLVISLELIYAIIIVSYLVMFNFSRNEGIPLLTNKFIVSIFPFCLSFFFFFFFSFSDSKIVQFIRVLNFSATWDPFHVENWNFVVGKYWTGHATFLTLVDEKFFLKSPIRKKPCAQFYLKTKNFKNNPLCFSLSLSLLYKIHNKRILKMQDSR